MIILQKEIINKYFTTSSKRKVKLWLHKEEDNPLTEIDKEDAQEIVRNFPELAEIPVKEGTKMEIYTGLEDKTISIVNFPALEIRLVDEESIDSSTIFTIVFIQGEESIREFFEGLLHS